MSKNNMKKKQNGKIVIAEEGLNVIIRKELKYLINEVYIMKEKDKLLQKQILIAIYILKIQLKIMLNWKTS